jgi:hypothetical protein
MDGHQITDAQRAKAFALAGKSIFTLVSKKSGERMTFKVRASKPERPGPSHFVSILDHADGTGSYSYLGFVDRGGQFVHGRKSIHDATNPKSQTARWLFAKLALDQLPDTCEFWHEGRCGRCGRRLTVPASIETGLGPECAGKART